MTDVVPTDAIISNVAELVRNQYVFADIGEHIASLLEDRYADGAYAGAGTAERLSGLVTTDLQSVNADKHLRLRFHLDPLPDYDADDDGEMATYAAMARDDMAGIRRIERLVGNVGLICFADLFYPAAIVGSSLAAAMSLIADTTALIVDLRENIGGDPGAVSMVISYLLDASTHLNSMVHRDVTQTTQHWSLPWVPGPRFGGTKPIWVLISSTTFSGGEELAYELQQLGRATLVGERTGGGAHAREGFVVHPHLELTVPVAAAHNRFRGRTGRAPASVPMSQRWRRCPRHSPRSCTRGTRPGRHPE